MTTDQGEGRAPIGKGWISARSYSAISMVGAAGNKYCSSATKLIVVLLLPLRVISYPMSIVWRPSVPLVPLMVIVDSTAMIEPVISLPDLPFIVSPEVFP